jgi:hypothetical protein
MDDKALPANYLPLHVCPGCASGLVQLESYEPLSWMYRRLARRCPECGWADEDVHTRQAALDFDEELDAGLAVLAQLATGLERESMEGFVEVFVAALRADVIEAEDFCRAVSKEWKG